MPRPPPFPPPLALHRAALPAAEPDGTPTLREAQQRAERSAGLLARIEALSRSGSFEIDLASGHMTLSAGLRALLGEAAQPVCEIASLEALAWVPPEERDYVAGIWRHAEPGEPFEFQHRVLCQDGQRLVVLHRGVLDAPGGRGVAILLDLTAQREAEQRIQDLVHTDEITGLPNRAALLDRLDAALHAVRWEGGGLALLALELPRIAEIKSSMGWAAGDTLVMAIAARLKSGCGDDTLVARVGDTEFAWLVEWRGDTPAETALAEAQARAAALLPALQAPVRLGSTEVFPLALIGLAAWPDDALSPGGLLEAAQAARLDLAGASGVARFRQEVAQRARRQMLVESALRRALVQGDELSLVYQPQIELAQGRICGAEALLRWQSTELGTVAPAEFIPIAERSGLIGTISDWVLEQVCAQQVAWREAGLPPLRVAVNLSPAQLQRPDLARQMRAVLARSGAAPELLAVELTESMLLSDVERARAVLHEIKALGVEIALDDFGTGYSCLSSLSQLPIDVLKIDRSFVHDVTADSQRVSVTRAIIHMAHGLQMKVLAEGVESEGQLALLASHGCDQFQGYWFSRPLAPEEFATLVRERRQLPEHLVARPQHPRTLLLVDDEANILAALKRLLRRDGYHIVTAASAEEGLQRLAEQPVDVIVSDQRMPGLTGVEFLQRAHALYPGTMRLVLSGYTELQSIIDAVNEGAIYKFLTKPWDDQHLRAHVAEAFRQKELADENRRLAAQVETANADLAALNGRLGTLLGRQRAQADLLATSADGLRQLLDELPLPMLGIDPEGLVVYANTSADELPGLDASPLGQPLAEVLPALAAQLDAGLGPPAPPPAPLTLHGRRYRLLVRRLERAPGLETLAGELDAPPRGQVLLLCPEPPEPRQAHGSRP